MIDSVCTEITQSDNTNRQSCQHRIEYSVNGQVYRADINSSTSLIHGTIIFIKYNPADPSDVIYNQLPIRYFGFGLSSFAIFIFFIISLNYYLTTRFKPLAAFQGANASIDAIKFLGNKFSN